MIEIRYRVAVSCYANKLGSLLLRYKKFNVEMLPMKFNSCGELDYLTACLDRLECLIEN